jgi:hypothetical protein
LLEGADQEINMKSAIICSAFAGSALLASGSGKQQNRSWRIFNRQEAKGDSSSSSLLVTKCQGGARRCAVDEIANINHAFQPGRPIEALRFCLIVSAMWNGS